MYGHFPSRLMIMPGGSSTTHSSIDTDDCSCTIRLGTSVLMWANTAEARHKSFLANLGPVADSARQWRLFDEYRHRNSDLAAGVTFWIDRAPMHQLGSNLF